MRKGLLIISLCCCLQAVFAQVSVKAEIDSTQILIGQQAHLSLEVIAPKHANVRFPLLQPRTYLSEGLEIVDLSPLDTIQQNDEALTIRQRYTLTAFEEKLYPIPTQVIQVDNKEYQTRPLALKVITLDVDTLHPEKFFPPKTIQRNPFAWSDLLPTTIGWFIAMVVCFILALAYRLYCSKVSFLNRWLHKKPLPPHQVALNALQQLRSTLSKEQLQAKAFYTHLTDILRRYLSQRFDISALEMTTREILAASKLLEEPFLQDVNEQTALRQLLEGADLAKFAKVADQEEAREPQIAYVQRFVEATKITEDKQQIDKVQPQTRKEKWLLIVLMSILFAIILGSLTYALTSLIDLIW